MRERANYAEPYRIKMVEPIRLIPQELREKTIAEAGYNVFNLRAQDVYIDLLTDSGTSAMSSSQWASVMIGDESYAGAESYYNFVDAVQDIFGYKYVCPTHQGRAAEHLVMGAFVSEGQRVLGNMHFDTTEGHIQIRGAEPINLLRDDGYDTSYITPFKGNMDLNKLEAELKEGAHIGRIPFVMMTVTCNSNGGQPVSMENIKAASELAHKYNVPFFFDAARYAENCYFIKMREKGYENKSIKEIAQEMFSYGDGATMSSKKDALVNIGGFFAIKDNESWYEAITQRQIQYEGFRTYGGLAGRDLEAIATGLYEGLDADYLENRIGQVKYLGDRLEAIGIPLQLPLGGHGVFIDAKKFLPHMEQKYFPAQALTVEIYTQGGIRGVELGTCAFGRTDPATGIEYYPELELVRLAIPRRVYTDRHMDAIVDTMEKIRENKEQIKRMQLVSSGAVMRHFTAKFKRID